MEADTWTTMGGKHVAARALKGSRLTRVDYAMDFAVTDNEWSEAKGLVDTIASMRVAVRFWQSSQGWTIAVGNRGGLQLRIYAKDPVATDLLKEQWLKEGWEGERVLRLEMEHGGKWVSRPPWEGLAAFEMMPGVIGAMVRQAKEASFAIAPLPNRLVPERVSLATIEGRIEYWEGRLERAYGEMLKETCLNGGAVPSCGGGGDSCEAPTVGAAGAPSLALPSGLWRTC